MLNGLGRDQGLQLYLADAQRKRRDEKGLLVLGLSAEGVVSADAIQRRLQEVLPSSDRIFVEPLGKNIADEVAPWWLGTQLFGALGLLAMIISAVGLYSVVNYGVVQRRREFGIRAALGEKPRQLMTRALRSGTVALVIGIAIGLVVSAVASPSAAALLFETSPWDGRVYLGTSVLLVVTGLGATLVPARRATLVDPAVVLREE
jgi:ABC-type antimicrobial peptide transport system permease subunit